MTVSALKPVLAAFYLLIGVKIGTIVITIYLSFFKFLYLKLKNQFYQSQAQSD